LIKGAIKGGVRREWGRKEVWRVKVKIRLNWGDGEGREELKEPVYDCFPWYRKQGHLLKDRTASNQEEKTNTSDLKT
jgi:hypothetical protein